jgi:two-component system CheB/CheR fusion protein
MTIEDGKLRLTERAEDHRQFMPIDHFLRSLALYAQNRAIGVILSGTASDGSSGLPEIKAVGGITIAQSPETARYDGMPRAAIATGIVDLVLSPQEIAAELVRISNDPYVRHTATLADVVPSLETHLDRVFAMLREVSGVDFRQYKQPTIKRRLHRRMVLHKIETVEHYVRFLTSNPEEVQKLYQDILIHVTRFFRDPASFDAMTRMIFPKIMEMRARDAPVRIWVPGCATGEEAYSVAIAFLEFLGDNAGPVPLQIFATDVSESAIERARSGIYPENNAGDGSAERLRRFFVSHDGKYRITKDVRDRCVFARQDLTRDPPFSKLDLIMCRNVLIYLAQPLQKQLITIFHYALKTNGFLVLAGAETIGPYVDLFSAVDKKQRIYRKKEAMVGDLQFGRVGAIHPMAHRKAGRQPTERLDVHSEAQRILLTRYSPPGVVVDEDMQILEFLGQTGRYLEPAAGDANLNLLKMAREGLMYGVRTAIHDVRKTGAAVKKEGLRVRSNHDWSTVDVSVIPLKTGMESHHFLVLFQEHVRKGKAPTASPDGKQRASKPKAHSPRHSDLEKELAASREYLQSIIQDLEAANEELQSANEEILSSNEELQSTNEELDTAKEELQSTNEELNTVNEELHSRNEELSRSNSDLVNLLGSVHIAIVMVSSDLRIRRFTPMAERVLNLIPGDLGRPITHITPNIECPNLDALITQVIDSVTVIEQEVRDRQGTWFSLRIRPYKNNDQRIDGAVLALFDVDTTKRAQLLVRDAQSFGETIVHSVSDPLLVVDDELRVKLANQAFCRVLGLSSSAIIERSLADVGDGAWASAVRDLLRSVLDPQGAGEGSALVSDGGGRMESLRLTARRLPSYGDGRPLALLTVKELAAKPQPSQARS